MAPYMLPKRGMMSLEYMSSYSTSGSEHDSLSFLVNEFLEQEYTSSTTDTSHNDSGDESDSDSVSVSKSSDRAIQVSEEIKMLVDPSLKSGRLFSDVNKALEGLKSLRADRSGFRRAVMTRLREKGYDSGLCKVRWDGSKGLAKGNYEYIDVVEIVDGMEERYIVDVGFAAEFEVAGPTDAYQTVLAALPQLALVARPDEVKRVLRIMAEEAKRSLKKRGLSVPPWRKRRFLMAKWLGEYKRTVNPISASVGNIPFVAANVDHVKCRKLGFVLPQTLGPVCIIGNN